MEQVVGDGWLRAGQVRIGMVWYIIHVHEFCTPRDGHVLTGTEVSVWLHHHAVAPYSWRGQVLTLAIADGRAISGFLSHDGSRLVRTGALT